MYHGVGKFSPHAELALRFYLAAERIKQQHVEAKLTFTNHWGDLTPKLTTDNNIRLGFSNTLDVYALS